MRFKLLKTSEGKPSKLSIGLSVAALVAMVGTAGVVGATPMGKPTKDQCKNFPNYGQCVKDWAKNKGGGGYGGNTNANINTNVNVRVNGNNNTVNVVIQYLFGVGMPATH